MNMMRLLIFALLLANAAFAQQKNAVEIAGTWEGSSICTVPNSPCHDEHVIYHFTQDPKDSTKFTVAADKVVNGQEEYMGTLNCVFTASKSELFCDNPGDWRFTVTGKSMKGTLVINKQTLYRKVSVEKK